ncbi:putative Zn-dependent peptidase [Clostridiales Family XIII bacterium PM5-7]
MIINKKLNSGIRMVLEDIPYVQSIAIGIWVKAGAVDEDPKHAGVSHFIEHMMFKGTEKRSAKTIAEDIDKIGGQINAFTGKEATCYYVKTIHNHYQEAADVLVDMLTNSVLDKEEMNKERQVICEEIKMTQDAPDDLAHDTITEMVFKGNPLGKSIIGTPSSLNRISRNVMVDYLRKEYTRDNIVVSVAGNFDVDEICAYFDEKFLSLAQFKEEKEDHFTEYQPSCKLIVKDIEQSHLCLATKGLKLTDERYFAFSILNNIMGGSMSSRLFQNIREQKGLAYSVYSMTGAFRDDGYYNIYAGVSHNKIKDAIYGIKEELDALEQQGITRDELESSREQLKAGYIFGQENVSGRMFKNGKNTILSGTHYTQEEVITSFDQVTMEDIEEVKKLICDFDQYSVVAVTNHKLDLRKVMKR